MENRALANNVIIHLPRIGENHAVWAVSDERGALTSDLQTGPLELAASQVEGKRVLLVLPGNDVLLTEAIVPGNSTARALQAIPFQLEDQVADDVDSLHFAIGSKGKADNYPVAVVSRDMMDTVREQCAQAGLRPSEIVPETLALPKFDSDEMDQATWTALVDKDSAVVRLNGYKGFAIDTSMAGVMLDGARQDLPEEISAAMVMYQSDSQAHFPMLKDLEVEARVCDNRLSLYASGLASAPRINLLQGEYNPNTQFEKNWKPWRWTAALVAVLGLTLLLGKWLEFRKLNGEIAQLDAQTEQVFKEAMPGSRMVRPLSQLETEIKKRSGGAIGGFSGDLSQIAASFATQPQTKIRSFNYRDGWFDIDLTTDAIPTLDLLKEELSKRGELGMTVKSTTNEKGGLRSRVRIE